MLQIEGEIETTGWSAASSNDVVQMLKVHTMLAAAADRGHVDIVSYLLGIGAAPNQRFGLGRVGALVIAAQN